MLSNNNFEQNNYLHGKLLIASPKLKDTCFEKAVIYICEHTKDGAMGLVLNHPLPHNKKQEIIKQLSLKTDQFENGHLPAIYLGGPVEIFRGFILHTDEYHSPDTQKLQNGLALSSSVNALQDIMIGNGPEESLIALGYAGWDSGQLEDEIQGDSWLCTDTSNDFIFNTKTTNKWEAATQSIGVSNMLHYSNAIGHA